MEDCIDLSRGLIAVGLALLLVMLRLDAERFGDGRVLRGDARRRAAARPAPAGLVRARARRSPSRLLYHPPVAAGRLSWARATGSGPCSAGSSSAAIGVAQAVAFATFRYHRIRFPDTWSYPGALLNSTATAFIDEVDVPRRALRAAADRAASTPTVANVIQALLYTLATRLGAPGRDRYLLVADPRDRPHRWLADRRHRRDRGRVPGPRHHPLRGLPVHRPHRPDAPRGREVEEIEKRRRTPEGWRVIGRGSRPRGTGDRVGARRRPRRPTAAPPVALYVHIPFCVSLCPYCDFVVVAGAAARGPTNRIGAFVAALLRRARPARRRARRARSAAGTVGAGARDRVPGRRHAVAAARRRRRAAARASSASGSASPPDAEVTLEANPGPDERGDAAALRAAGVTRLSFGAQCFDDAELRRLGRRHRAGRRGRRRRRGARGAASRSVSLDLLYDVPDADAGDLDGDARRRARPRARPPLALRPDARRPGRRGPDRPRRRPPADHAPARVAGATSARPARTRIAPRRSTTTPTIACRGRLRTATRSATGRGPVTRAGTTSPTGSGGRTRRSGPGAHAFDGVTRRWNAARLDGYLAALAPADGRRAACRRVARRPIDPATAAAEAVILGLRTDRGVPLAAPHEPPLADAFGWALAAELLDVTADDRIVLTTRGRLLSNELFARLV